MMQISLFEISYKKVKDMMSKLGAELKLLRNTDRQMHRNNIKVISKDNRSYWRISIYIPILDEVMKNFDNKFSSKNMQCFNLNFLMPSNVIKFQINNKCIQ